MTWESKKKHGRTVTARCAAWILIVGRRTVCAAAGPAAESSEG
ncbi:MAG: hypothetical protein ACLT2F_04220 [Butyricicoccus sp.]